MSRQEEVRKFTVEIPGRDHIEVSLQAEGTLQVRFKGCSELMDLMKSLRKNFGTDVRQWPVPQGSSHSEMLLRELIMKLRGEWNFPFKEAETCHCRNVPTSVVDQAIVAGAHTTAIVTRQTSASSACGTCRPDVQSMIDYRLHAGCGSACETNKKSA